MLLCVDSGLRPDLSRRGYRFIKRFFDIVASGLALAVLLVPGLVLSTIIYVKSPGASPFYSQLRVGRLRKDGKYRLFRMWKFRSMVPCADEMLSELRDKNEADGPLFKMKQDPRVIPGIGVFIRRHSIDELAQLINVFVGDMSLIGPRPGLPNEVALYDENAKRRLVVKPGCGGAWQVGGRSDATFDQMVELDIDYIEKRSCGYDLSLIIGTIKTMLSGGGAY
ncbi:MAG: sugar transferase [Eggerthellaceae bacterium]|nr:sugar transferase [Eggerthellaceae bacterium]